jgi:hypothetical protein
MGESSLSFSWFSGILNDRFGEKQTLGMEAENFVNPQAGNDCFAPGSGH